MRFMVVHKMEPKLSRQQAADIQEATQKDEHVKGYRSFVNLTEGRAYCLYDAPTHDHLMERLKAMSLPFESITQIEFEGEAEKLWDVPALTNVRL